MEYSDSLLYEEFFVPFSKAFYSASVCAITYRSAFGSILLVAVCVGVHSVIDGIRRIALNREFEVSSTEKAEFLLLALYILCFTLLIRLWKSYGYINPFA